MRQLRRSVRREAVKNELARKTKKSDLEIQVAF
jgi:hypothetical protein